MTTEVRTPDTAARIQGLHELRERYTPLVRSAVVTARNRAQDQGAPREIVHERKVGAFEAAELIEPLVAIDPLTKLLRRDYFKDRTEQACRYVDRNPEVARLDFSLMDLDDYGKFNKKYGERAGDLVLAMTGETILEYTRSEDASGRWGGEEIVFAFPNANQEESGVAATTRVKEAISAMTIPLSGAELTERVTGSFGTTEYRPGETFEDIFDRASTAMRLAKLFGKDRVVMAIPQEDGTLLVVDQANGHEYIYTNKIVEHEDGKKELYEYLLDRTEQTRNRIVRDEKDKKYIKIEEVLDVAE